MKRRRPVIMQFALNPVSGELLALDNTGNMWAGGRENVEGRMTIAWQRIGGLPYVDVEDEPTADKPAYTPPASLPRFDHD